MAKYTSKKADLTVSYDGGFINFKNGVYDTTDKKQIEALEKAVDVEKEATPTTRTRVPKED